MWSSFFVQLLLLPLLVIASKDSQSTRFEKYHSKSLSAAPLKLDDASFDEITGSQRDYSALLLLTAMPSQFGCQICRQFQPEFEVLSKSWVSEDREGTHRLLFGVLDFPDGKGTFQKVDLHHCMTNTTC